MERKIATFLILIGAALNLPTPALAQTQNPPADYWYGPWFMGGWSSWWWICPMMMVVMMLVMMFACRFMGGGWHRDGR